MPLIPPTCTEVWYSIRFQELDCIGFLVCNRQSGAHTGRLLEQHTLMVKTGSCGMVQSFLPISPSIQTMAESCDQKLLPLTIIEMISPALCLA